MRRIGRVLILALITLVVVVAHMLLQRILPRQARRLPGMYFRLTCRCLGIRLRVIGQADPRACLVVANHLSYLDIPILGAILDVAFVSRADVAAWPVVGMLARRAGTLFIERRPHLAEIQRIALARRLAAGDRLLLFPEGTSSDGSRLLPFKSSLFAVIYGAEASAEASPREIPPVIQPVSLTHLRLADGRAVEGPLRDLYSWWGDTTFMPHFLRVLALPGLEAEVRLLPALSAADFPSRKALALACHAAVAEGLRLSQGGRTAETERDERVPWKRASNAP